MPALANMEILTHGIAQSHRDRIEGIHQLKATVGTMLKELDGAHHSMSVSLNSSLAKGRTTRKTAVERTLDRHEKARKAMSRALHAGLFRTKTDSETDVRAMLTGIKGTHLDMARSLRHSLARNAADCRASVRRTIHDRGATRQALGKSLHMDLSRENTGRKAAVRGMLAALDRSQRGMSKDLHANLAHSEASLRATTAALLKDFKNQQAELRTELTAVRGEWQGLVTTMDAARRGSALATMAAKPMVFAAPRAPIAAPVAQGTSDETPELAALRQRVFEYLADHPDGTRLVEMEIGMNSSRFQMSRVLRSLMDENKVEKRNLLYFAI